MKSEEKVHIFVEDSNGLMSALATYLSQEMERFNRLLFRIKSSLESLKKAIKGLVLMSDDLDQMYTSINENRVPSLWSKVAYPSLKPLASWLHDLKSRVKFLREWLSVGKPEAYWLSAFFFPQGFLTSVLQMHARQYKEPIDTLGFSVYYEETSQVRQLKKKPEEQGQNSNSVYVYGLFTEGCRWDFDVMQLDEARPGEMHSAAPIIQFVPSEKGQTEEGEVSMPIYKTSERAGVLSTTGHSTNYIISIDCPCSKTPAHWILRGGAFLCQLND
jgi:dynein heavy chain